MLDLYKLQIFLAVVQEGSFSAAGERLYITQSAVSQHIKDLEAGLGRPLFERGWRGVSLTPEGEILYRYARQIFALVAEAENALTDVERVSGGRVSIGATPGAAVYLAPDWVQRFRARYPQLTVALQTGVTAQIVAEVLSNRLDVGFIEGELESFRQPRLESLALQEIEQVVVVGFKHPWWERSSAAIEDLHRQSFIVRPPNSQSRAWLEETLRVRGIEPVIGAEFDNLESIKRAVIAGMCLAVLPPYVVQDEVSQGLLHVVALEGQPLRRTLRLIWDRDIHFAPVTRAFIESLSGDYPALKTIRDDLPDSQGGSRVPER